jgi:hypothetical protein
MARRMVEAQHSSSLPSVEWLKLSVLVAFPVLYAQEKLQIFMFQL